MFHPPVSFDTDLEEVRAIKDCIDDVKLRLSELSEIWNKSLNERKLPLNQERSIFRTTVMARMILRNHIRTLENQITQFLETPDSDLFYTISSTWKYLYKQIKITYKNFDELKYFDEEEEIKELERPATGSWWKAVKSERQKRNEDRDKWLKENNILHCPSNSDETSSDGFSTPIESDPEDKPKIKLAWQKIEE